MRSVLSWIALVLLVIGGLNWGLVGIWDWNLVEVIFGMGTIAKVIYILVGIAGLWGIYYLFADK